MTDTVSTTTTEIPGYVAGTWDIDPVHTDISFTVRHMMVSKVRGHFETFEGTVTTGVSPLDSTVEVSIDLASINTNNDDRDNHIRGDDFFGVEQFPKMTYRSTGVRQVNGDYVVDGELTLRGVTKPVSLELEVNGFGPDPFGGTRSGFSAKGEISRKEFDVKFDAAMEGGGVVVGDRIQLAIEAELVLRKDEDQA
jgi:polyisoprenoid-binding protein YceI